MKRFLSKIPTGVLTVIVFAAIMWFTLVPHPTGKMSLSLFPGADKIAHGVMFFALTAALLTDIMKKQRWQALGLPVIGLTAFVTTIAGVIIEIAQRKMGLGRSFETLDIIADAAGAFLAAGIWAALQKTWSDREGS